MDNSGKVILHLYSGSEEWSRHYKEAGYNVICLDIKNASDHDVRTFQYKSLMGRTYGILIGAPCTHFAASGARWWRSKGKEAILEGLALVDASMRIVMVLQPKWWVLENPVGRLNRWLGPPVMYFNPYDYGDPYTKKTCLWGNFNKPKKNPVKPTEGSKMHLISPSPDRAEKRAITPPGFAKAFFDSNK